MSFLKLSSIATALLGFALSTQAMTPLSDEQLATTKGQDGVSVAGDLNLQIGSFRYTDTDSTGGSISFDKIKVTGMFVVTIDILNGDSFTDAVSSSMSKYGLSTPEVYKQLFKLAKAGVYDAKSDVVQIAIPNAGMDSRLTPSISVGAVRMGSFGTDDVGPSFGSFAINNINAQGTKLWIWAH